MGQTDYIFTQMSCSWVLNPHKRTSDPVTFAIPARERSFLGSRTRSVQEKIDYSQTLQA